MTKLKNLFGAVVEAFFAPNPYRVSVKQRLLLIRDHATSEPIEVAGASFKCGYGLFLALPNSRILETAHAYIWMGAWFHAWGWFIVLSGLLQLWAILYRQTKQARLYMLAITEPFIALFATICFVDAVTSTNPWSPLWFVYFWLSLMTLWAAYRISGRKELENSAPVFSAQEQSVIDTIEIPKD